MHTNSKTVIIIHIPKAAGTTLQEVMWRQCKPQRVFYFYRGPDQHSIDTFRELPEHTQARLRYIGGHMPFGLHQWLPQPTTYITILRNPVERIVSDYYHVCKNPIHRSHSEPIEKNISLEYYIQRIVDENTTNLQTRWVSGCVDFDSVIPPYENLPANALDLAKENIENFFSVCGLIERFDESLLLMQKILGWKNVYYMRRNVGKRRASKDQLSGTTRRLIEKYEEKDLELVEYAAKGLSEMLDEKARVFRKNQLPSWSA